MTFLVSVNADLTLHSYHGGWVWLSDNPPGPGIPDVRVLFSPREGVHPFGFDGAAIEQFFRNEVFPINEPGSFGFIGLGFVAVVITCSRRKPAREVAEL